MDIWQFCMILLKQCSKMQIQMCYKFKHCQTVIGKVHCAFETLRM